MHERGEVPKDVKLASRLYQRGCDKGSLLSCSNLGAIYSNGTGVSKDEKLAVKLYQRACDGGIGPLEMATSSPNRSRDSRKVHNDARLEIVLGSRRTGKL
jgi:TPR repeat protein